MEICIFKIKVLTYLQIFAGVLAVSDPLNLSGGTEVHGLTQVGEAERPGYPHVCQRQVVYIHKRSQSWQTREGHKYK